MMVLIWWWVVITLCFKNQSLYTRKMLYPRWARVARLVHLKKIDELHSLGEQRFKLFIQKTRNERVWLSHDSSPRLIRLIDFFFFARFIGGEGLISIYTARSVSIDKICSTLSGRLCLFHLSTSKKPHVSRARSGASINYPWSAKKKKTLSCTLPTSEAQVSFWIAGFPVQISFGIYNKDY